MYTDAIGRELLTPFSYSAFKPYQQTHGILFEEEYNPQNHPDPIDGVSFTPADLEGTTIQAPSLDLYQQAIETENTYHQQALATLEKQIVSLTQEAKKAKSETAPIAALLKARAELKEATTQLEEAEVVTIESFEEAEAVTIESFQEVLFNLIQQGTQFGDTREAVREAPEDKKKLYPFLKKEEKKELEDALAKSTNPEQRNQVLNEVTQAYYNSSLKPMVDLLLQNPYFKYYPKTPSKGKLHDSDAMKGFIQLLSQKKLTEEGDITQKQENAKQTLETLAKEKADHIEVIQTLIADEEKLPLEEKSQEANLRQQLVALAIHRPNEAMVLYWRLVHIVQGKKATSTLEAHKTAAENIQETKAQTDFFNRLNTEPTPYRDQRKKDLINAIRSKTPEAASAFECGSKYHSSWGKRTGQSFGLIVIAAAGALGGAGLAGDFSAVKTVGDIFTATGADITAFESHTWILMSVCAALFLAAAVAGARWDRHHGQVERALADELREKATPAPPV